VATLTPARATSTASVYAATLKAWTLDDERRRAQSGARRASGIRARSSTGSSRTAGTRKTAVVWYA
jgi:hypothetical protein